MKKKMRKDVVWGIILVLLAVYLIVSRLNLIPGVPFFTVAFTIVFGYTLLNGILKCHITQSVMSLALLGCVYDKYLGIEAITPWVLLGAALLLSIGLEMIFKGARRRDFDKHIFENGKTTVTDFVDGEEVYCSNSFGSTGKYVNSDHFVSARMENNFGSMNVYFDNAIMAGSSAKVKVETNFGETNLYFPGTWRVELQQESAFGRVKINGKGSSLPEAPVVRLKAEANFGSICVYFS